MQKGWCLWKINKWNKTHSVSSISADDLLSKEKEGKNIVEGFGASGSTKESELSS